jgi:hypothetical protein
MFHHVCNKNKTINLLQDNGEHTTVGPTMVFITQITAFPHCASVWLIYGPDSKIFVHVRTACLQTRVCGESVNRHPLKSTEDPHI